MAYTKDIQPTKKNGGIKAQVNASRADETQKKSKYEQALDKYNCDVDEAEIGKALKKIIVEKVPENDTAEVKKFLLGSVELTSLSASDNDVNIMAMVEKVNQFDTCLLYTSPSPRDRG